jgi:hypothetical protein
MLRHPLREQKAGRPFLHPLAFAQWARPTTSAFSSEHSTFMRATTFGAS